ncbi:hypothetical protein NB716_002765 [Pantoea ananatis]|nr:hypothetical protein [Pantoea ananatis]
MKVLITQNSKLLWMYNRISGEGITSVSFAKDGKHLEIIAALENALAQAKGELLSWDHRNGMSDIRPSSP